MLASVVARDSRDRFLCNASNALELIESTITFKHERENHAETFHPANTYCLRVFPVASWNLRLHWLQRYRWLPFRSLPDFLASICSYDTSL